MFWGIEHTHVHVHRCAKQWACKTDKTLLLQEQASSVPALTWVSIGQLSGLGRLICQEPCVFIILSEKNSPGQA